MATNPQSPREWYEQLERQVLSKRAALSSASKGRDKPEPCCQYRTAYQRDRDRILHSKAFRRLKHKTQVFLSPGGDHYRTRLTHTLEVSQIARTIARALRLNEDLTEAIALGHDLGHTPFGHAGERALDRLMEGGFRHNQQSLRVVEKLENNGAGLNLTYEVKNGIRCHTNGADAETLEGQIVRLADRVAYINHDIDDAIRAGLLTEADVPADIRQVLGNSLAQRVDRLVTAIVTYSSGSGAGIGMPEEVAAAFHALRQFMFDKVYTNPTAKSEETKVESFIQHLFDRFVSKPELLPPEYAATCETEGIPRAVCDYIAGMSDTYAIEIYHEQFIPKSWGW